MMRQQIDKLVNAIRDSWDSKTCYPELKTQWDEQNPALGQCAVTALFIQEKCGGQILYNQDYDHYWNQLPDGNELDLTKDQFSFKKNLKGSPVKPEVILTSPNARRFRTSFRFSLLKRRVQKTLVIHS